MVAVRAVCVFCGSSVPSDARYREAARTLGALIARGGAVLVYGGSSVGLMGELADAALAQGTANRCGQREVTFDPRVPLVSFV